MRDKPWITKETENTCKMKNVLYTLPSTIIGTPCKNLHKWIEQIHLSASHTEEKRKYPASN